jgi:hypothetical protein
MAGDHERQKSKQLKKAAKALEKTGKPKAVLVLKASR